MYPFELNRFKLLGFTLIKRPWNHKEKPLSDVESVTFLPSSVWEANALAFEFLSFILGYLTVVY